LFPVTMIEQISALSQFGRYSVLFSEVVCWCMDWTRFDLINVCDMGETFGIG
jgi:hypothetical protein